MSRVEYHFNRDKTINFVQNIVVLVSLVLTIFVIGSNDLIYAIQNNYLEPGVNATVSRREFVLSVIETRNGKMITGSFLVFPGADKINDILDMFYLIVITTLFILLPVIVVAIVARREYYEPRYQELLSRYWRLLFLFIPIISLIFHLFGNFFYQFYCDVKVIPSENCFWMFDYRSFLMGFAGIITATPAIAVSIFILRYLYRAITCKLCFDKVLIPDPEAPVPNPILPTVASNDSLPAAPTPDPIPIPDPVTSDSTNQDAATIESANSTELSVMV